MSIEHTPNQPNEFDEELPESEKEVEWVMDETPDIEYMQAMIAAYSLADSINAMKKDEKEVKETIKRKSLAVISVVVDRVYDEFFDKDDDED